MMCLRISANASSRATLLVALPRKSACLELLTWSRNCLNDVIPLGSGISAPEERAGCFVRRTRCAAARPAPAPTPAPLVFGEGRNNTPAHERPHTYRVGT